MDTTRTISTYRRSTRNPAIAKENVIKSRATMILGREFSADMTVWGFIFVRNMTMNPMETSTSTKSI
jgi:hypothetical protein